MKLGKPLGYIDGKGEGRGVIVGWEVEGTFDGKVEPDGVEVEGRTDGKVEPDGVKLGGIDGVCGIDGTAETVELLVWLVLAIMLVGNKLGNKLNIESRSSFVIFRVGRLVNDSLGC